MRADFIEGLADLDGADAARLIERLAADHIAQAGLFRHWRSEGQVPPRALPDGSPWRTWIIVGGRGFGKTRAGAEWVLARLRDGGADTHVALVGGCIDEARRVMIEGPSGLLNCALDREIAEWSASRRDLRFAGGAHATLYSGASPDMLRGPEHDFAWGDEIGKWPCAQETWDNLQLGLRRGLAPQAVVTTTPRGGSIVAAITAEPDCVRTGGSSHANPYLPAAFLRAVVRRYAGTRQGAEEIEGRIIADVEGSLWPAKLVERCRSRGGPETLAAAARRVVIGVDPPASANGTCGIVACATLQDSSYAVLADESVEGASPEGWANAVAIAAERWGADRVVAERNQGGDMVAAVLRAARRALPLKLVHAARGKSARAEPIAALFENGEAKFAGVFPRLEAELAGLQSGGGYRGPGKSPDRADAMVWALTELALGVVPAEPRVRSL